ncbi:MAG: hypothetical protein IR160_04285 [Salinibacterium sp.]|nr:hypothetical protein [Salinibacterium sp.]MBF0671786.1 hypothetical protein [Salinibacterium sp.]
MKGSHIATALVFAVALVAPLTACAHPPSSAPGNSELNCSQLLTSAIAYERSGSGDIDSVLQALSDHCSNEYEIAVDFLANSTDSAFSIDSCEQLLEYGTRRESVTLLEQDGRCTFGGGAGGAVVGPEWPEGGLGWDAAGQYAGTIQRVCGPLISARETADGTFLNIGQDYPSPTRFTIIFWDLYLQPIQPGATLCGSGEIYLYNGVAQMEMRDPAALEIWT